LVDRQLRQTLRRARLGLLLDFDGTLSELAATPEEASLHPACSEAVSRLLEQNVSMAVVSGRTSRDLQQRFPFERAWLSGVHGAELVVPGPASLSVTPTPELRAALESFLDGARALVPWGVRLEDKRLAVAAHVRGVEPPERQREAIVRLADLAHRVAATTGVVSWIEGKAVIELRSRHASKANAVHMLHRYWDAGTFLIAIGDDTTDEDMFVETLSYGGMAVKVGNGRTVAPHRLADPSDVALFLSTLATALAEVASQR